MAERDLFVGGGLLLHGGLRLVELCEVLLHSDTQILLALLAFHRLTLVGLLRLLS